MIEYKIVQGTYKAVATTLNQWRHKYRVNIISVNWYKDSLKTDWIEMLLTREETQTVELPI